MNPLVAVLPITIALTGIAIFLTETLAPAPPRTPRARSWRISRTAARALLPRLLAGTGLGVAVALISGWPVALLAVPAGMLLLPRVFTNPDVRGLRLTEALADWTRNLAGLVRTGSLGLEEVLRFSLPATPDLLRPHVAALVSRLRAGWDTETALRAFADALADPTVDQVTVHLIQAARKRAGDLPLALAALGREMAAELRMRREVEADRAKPRQSLRLVTLITLTVIAALVMFGRTAQFAAYATPTGQLWLTIWIGLYAALLLWAHAVLRERPAPRILTPLPRDRS